MFGRDGPSLVFASGVWVCCGKGSSDLYLHGLIFSGGNGGAAIVAIARQGKAWPLSRLGDSAGVLRSRRIVYIGGLVDGWIGR